MSRDRSLSVYRQQDGKFAAAADEPDTEPAPDVVAPPVALPEALGDVEPLPVDALPLMPLEPEFAAVFS